MPKPNEVGGWQGNGSIVGGSEENFVEYPDNSGRATGKRNIRAGKTGKGGSPGVNMEPVEQVNSQFGVIDNTERGPKNKK